MDTLSDSLKTVLKNYNLEKTYKQSKVMELWDKVVGERIAEHTEPVKIEHGKLVVKAESPAWRNEVQYYQEQIKQEINKELRETIIRKIIFV